MQELVRQLIELQSYGLKQSNNGNGKLTTGSGVYPEWLHAAKKAHLCAQKVHDDSQKHHTGSTSCSCSRTLLKSRSQLALALAGPGSMISLFGKLKSQVKKSVR